MALRISLNNNYTVENNLTFNNIPTIVKIEDVKGGTKSKITITIQSDSTLNENTLYYLSFSGVELTGSFDINKVKNNVFLLSKTSRYSNNVLAYYLCQALRNVKEISAAYNIYQEDVSSNKVTLVGKKEGFLAIGEDLSTNLPSSAMDIDGNAGSSLSALDEQQILLDVYAITDKSKQNVIGTSTPNLANYNFVTQLSKVFTNGEVKFDLTPILASLTENDKITEYQCNISSFDNNNTLQTIGKINNNYAINGYCPNYLSPKTYTYSNVYIMQDLLNGNQEGFFNKTKLYIGKPELKFKLIRKLPTTTGAYTISYKNQLNQEIYRADYTLTFRGNIYDVTELMNEEKFKQSAYIDLIIKDLGTIRYEVLNQLYYSDKVLRIYWYNSFGGISFFDFIGNESDNFDFETTLYNTSKLDYFNTDYSSQKIYKNDVEKEYTVYSHLIPEDAMYIFEDMINSKELFLLNNSIKSNVIITSFVKEEQNVNNLYKCQINFKIK